MAASTRAWMHLERNLQPQHQVRFASGALLDRLKKLTGFSRDEASVIESTATESTSEFRYENVQDRMKAVSLKSFASVAGESWRDIPTQDIATKYRLLKNCHEEFGSLPPNNIINESCVVNDFVIYYETQRRPGIIPQMWKLQNQKLPKNLSIEVMLPLKEIKTKR